MKFSAVEIASATGGALLQHGAAGSVCTDTRKVGPGDWFVALRGPRFDGHDYVAQALASGAVGVVVERPVDVSGAGLVQVTDTTVAYGALGLAARRRLRCPVIGLTGTSGKTTTRALIALALRPLGSIHQTQHNLNNHIGVPLTLLSSPLEPAAVVVEMGTSGPGEIRRLALMGEPTHRLIINVGHGHLEELGDIDGVAREKGAMFTTARPGDVLFVNLDDVHVASTPRPDGVRCVTFGRAQEASVRILDVRLDPDRVRTLVTLWVGAREVVVDLPVFGVHFASNVAAAMAIAVDLGVYPEAAAASLLDYEPVGMRQRMHRLDDGRRVFNDCYNANPESTRGALDSLAHLPGPNVAVLGDMLELGAHERSLHEDVLRHAVALGIEHILVLGPRFTEAAASFGAVRTVPAPDDVAAELARIAPPYANVLIKGSRGMRLERVVAALVPDFEEA